MSDATEEIMRDETIQPDPVQPAPANNGQADLLAKALREYEQEFSTTTKHTETGAATNIDTSTPAPGTAPTVETGTAKKSLSHLVKGKHAVNLLDTILPAVLVFTINLIGYRVTKDKLKLDKEEKETLTPFVEDWLQAIEIDMNNPHYNLLIGISIVYGSKIIDALPSMKKGRGAKTEDVEHIEERETAIDMQEVPSIVLFEQDYNKEVNKVMEEKQKGTLGARKWLADHEPQKIKFLMTKYGVQDDKYLMYSNIYKKEKEASKYGLTL